MNAYFLPYALAAVLSVASLDRRVPARLALGLLFVLLTVFVGLRYASADYFSYEWIWRNVRDISQLGLFVYQIGPLTPIESGFALSILAAKQVYDSFPFFVFLIAAVSLGVKFAAIRKMSSFCVISVLIYVSNEYLFKDLGQIRNALSSGIVLYSVVYVLRRDVVRFVIFVLVATSVHMTAIVALPLYFVTYFAAGWVLGSTLALSFAVAAMGGLGVPLVTAVADLLNLGDAARLVKYLTDDFTSGIALLGGTMMLHLLLSLLMLIFRRRLIEANAYNSVLIPMYIYGTALMFVFLDYGIVNSRLRELLCVPAEVIVVPTFLLLARGSEQKVLACCALVAIYFVVFVAFSRGVTPYESLVMAH